MFLPLKSGRKENEKVNWKQKEDADWNDGHWRGQRSKVDAGDHSAADRHWHSGTSHPLAMWHDPFTRTWKRPDPVLI